MTTLRGIAVLMLLVFTLHKRIWGDLDWFEENMWLKYSSCKGPVCLQGEKIWKANMKCMCLRARRRDLLLWVFVVHKYWIGRALESPSGCCWAPQALAGGRGQLGGDGHATELSPKQASLPRAGLAAPGGSVCVQTGAVGGNLEKS